MTEQTSLSSDEVVNVTKVTKCTKKQWIKAIVNSYALFYIFILVLFVVTGSLVPPYQLMDFVEIGLIAAFYGLFSLCVCEILEPLYKKRRESTVKKE